MATKKKTPAKKKAATRKRAGAKGAAIARSSLSIAASAPTKKAPAKKPAKAKKQAATPNRIRCYCGKVFDHDPKFQRNVTCPQCARWLAVPVGRELYLAHGGEPVPAEREAVLALQGLRDLREKLLAHQRNAWAEQATILREADALHQKIQTVLRGVK